MTVWPKRGLTQQKRRAQSDERAPHVEHGSRTSLVPKHFQTIAHASVIRQVRRCRVERSEAGRLAGQGPSAVTRREPGDLGERNSAPGKSFR